MKNHVMGRITMTDQEIEAAKKVPFMETCVKKYEKYAEDFKEYFAVEKRLS